MAHGGLVQGSVPACCVKQMQTWMLGLLVAFLAVIIYATTRTRRNDSLPQAQNADVVSTGSAQREARREPLQAVRVPLSGARKALVACGSTYPIDSVIPLVQILQARHFQVQTLPAPNSQSVSTAAKIFLSSLQPGDMGVLWIRDDNLPSMQQELALLKTGVRLLIGLDIANTTTTLGLAFPFIGAEDLFSDGDVDAVCAELESATVQVRTAAEVGKVAGLETNAEVLLVSGRNTRHMTRAVVEILKRYSFTFNVTLSGLQGAASSLLRNAQCPGAIQLSLGRELSPTSSISAWGL